MSYHIRELIKEKVIITNNPNTDKYRSNIIII